MEYKYLLYPGKRPNNTKQFLLNELTYYLKSESKKGHHPSRRELENQFSFKLDSLCKNIKDLYYLSNVKYAQKPNQSLKSNKATCLTNVIVDEINKFNLTINKIRQVHEHGVDILTNNFQEPLT